MGVVVKVVKEPVEKKVLLLDKDVRAGEVIYTVRKTRSCRARS